MIDYLLDGDSFPTDPKTNLNCNQSQSDIWHDMDDAPLFHLALSSAQNSTEIKCDVPKIAFLFLTRGPLPLALLWSR